MSKIEHTLRTLIEKDKADTFVVVVPNDAARLKRQSELIGYHPNKSVVNLQVVDIENFVQRLYSQVHPSKDLISPGLQRLWLHELMDPHLSNADAYQYTAFRPSQNIPIPDSTLTLIADTIDSLRERAEDTQNITAENPTSVGLERIYNEYGNRLGKLWIDDKGKHLYLANHFEPRFMKQAFPNIKLFVVEGFSVLSKADIKLFKRIAGITDIEMWFRTDYYPDNENLYNNITQLVSEFENVNVNIDADFERCSDEHNHFAQNLFKTNTISENRIDLTNQIKELRPSDRNEEVEQIAHLIQKHASSGKYKLGDICIAFYNIGQYQQRIRETFPAYGIPYSLTENVPLIKSDLVKAIFSILLSERSPISDIYFSDVEPISQTETLHPADFRQYVENLLNDSKVIQNILNTDFQGNRYVVESEMNALQQFKRIVRELCYTLMIEGNGTDRIIDYITKLNYIAKHTHFQNRNPISGDSVKIVPLGELRSSSYDILFLGDCVDGGFPQPYRPDPLLPDNPYPTEDVHLYDNRFLFYRVLKAYRKRLYLLSPKREREAELIPSIFLTQLKAITDIDSKEVRNPERTSLPGFFGVYGNHVWSVDSPCEGEFPGNNENMRLLINHVVSVEKSRENTHDNLTYEGIVNLEALSTQSREKLQELRNSTYSVTDLEIYAKCPFQYFVSKVLELKVEEEEVEDEPSSLEKGSLLHEVLYKFYSYLSENGHSSVAQCNEKDYEEAKQKLDELLNVTSEIKRNERTDVNADNLFWIIEIEKQRTTLHKWLTAERINPLQVEQRFFEVSFGKRRGNKDQSLTCSETIEIGGIRLKGQIDRIDIINDTFNVIDYKTGSTIPKMADILEGRSLQIPIYLQIAKKLFEEHSEFGEKKPTAGIYYKIRLDEFKTELGIGSEDSNEEGYINYNGSVWKEFSKSYQLLPSDIFFGRLNRVERYVKQYVDSIADGYFPIITHVDKYVENVDEGDLPLKLKDPKAPCSYCSYKRVCRVGAFVESYQSDE